MVRNESIILKCYIPRTAYLCSKAKIEQRSSKTSGNTCRLNIRLGLHDGNYYEPETSVIDIKSKPDL